MRLKSKKQFWLHTLSRELDWRIFLLKEMVTDLPEMWKVWSDFEALCMGRIERHSCYKDAMRELDESKN